MSQQNIRKSFVRDRRKSEGSIETPGPAAYNISRDLCFRSISFTRAVRSSCNHNTSPGPGYYNISSNIGNGPKVVISRSRNSIEPQSLPGPSDYSPNYSASAIGYSFPKRKYSDKYETTPGPGDYETQIRITGPRPTIGRAKRLLLDINNDLTKPITLKNKISPIGNYKIFEANNNKNIEGNKSGISNIYSTTNNKSIKANNKRGSNSITEEHPLGDKFTSKTFATKSPKYSKIKFKENSKPPRSISTKKRM